MYSLYHNKEDNEIEVKKAHKALQNVKYKEEITRYNSYYYLCLHRKPLIELANQMREAWIKEYEDKINDLKNLKI